MVGPEQIDCLICASITFMLYFFSFYKIIYVCQRVTVRKGEMEVDRKREKKRYFPFIESHYKL